MDSIKPSSEALVQVGDRGVQLRSISDALDFGRIVIESGLAPKGFTKPEQVVVSVQTGAELGIPPMRALATIPVVNGRPAIMGDAALALVYQSGLVDGKVEEFFDGDGDNRAAVCRSRRKGHHDPTEHRFSIADAKRAKLWAKSGPWSEYPQRMMMYRARGFHLRDLYADVLLGLHIVEEMRDVTPEKRREPAPNSEPDPLLDDATDAVEIEREAVELES